MPTSDSWRDLSAQFFDASRTSAMSAKREFQKLARRGASWFNPPPVGDLLEAWIDALRQRKPDGLLSLKIFALCELSVDFCNAMEREALERETQIQGSGSPQPDLSERVRALETAYLAKAEEERESETDPRHWSPMRQHYGAVRVIPSNTTGTDEKVESKSEHRAEVDAFLCECNKLSDTRIHRRHIWRSVGHSKGRQFEYWQANDARATNADHSNFGRILREGPEKFLAMLRTKKLI